MDTVAGGPAHFEYETTEAHVPVRWFKDGSELGHSCLHFSQEDMGIRHRLVANLVTRLDEGTYSCPVGEHSVDFQLRVCGELTIPGLVGGEQVRLHLALGRQSRQALHCLCECLG